MTMGLATCPTHLYENYKPSDMIYLDDHVILVVSERAEKGDLTKTQPKFASSYTVHSIYVNNGD